MQVEEHNEHEMLKLLEANNYLALRYYKQQLKSAMTDLEMLETEIVYVPASYVPHYEKMIDDKKNQISYLELSFEKYKKDVIL